MANNITVKDGNAVLQVVKTTDNAGVHTPHHNVDSMPALPIGANHIGQVGVDNAAGAGAVNIQDGGNSITVDGAVTVSGTVTASAQPGVDIGDVTVNNAGGASAVNVQDGGNSITVDGTVGVSGTVTVADNQTITDNAGFTDGTSKIFPAGFVFDEVAGTALTENDAAAARIDDKRAQVLVIEDAVTRGRRVTVSSSNNLRVDGSTVTQPVAGSNAHDAAVTQNPLIGGVVARTTDPTAVTGGNASRVMGDTLGKQVVLLGAVHDRHVRGTINRTDTTAADLVAAGGAGVRIVVTSVLVTNAHATVGTKVEIRDGTTVKIQAFAAAAGGGFALCDPHGLFISTANTAVTGRCVTTGSDVDITVAGYTISN